MKEKRKNKGGAPAIRYWLLGTIAAVALVVMGSLAAISWLLAPVNPGVPSAIIALPDANAQFIDPFLNGTGDLGYGALSAEAQAAVTDCPGATLAGCREVALGTDWTFSRYNLETAIDPGLTPDTPVSVRALTVWSLASDDAERRLCLEVSGLGGQVTGFTFYDADPDAETCFAAGLADVHYRFPPEGA